jgi:serine phosphatase RsbU (regulator of sigma subunit)
MKKKAMLSEEALAAMLSAEEGTVASTEVVEATDSEQPVESKDEIVEEAKDEVPAFDAYQKDFDEFKAEAEARLEAAELNASEVIKAADELKEIVASQISKMRLALKLPVVDLASMSTETIVAEFHNTKDAFMKALPVGSVVPEKKEEKKMETPVATSLDASKIATLGF